VACITKGTLGHAMTFPRRRFLQLAAGAAVAPTVSPMARAQAYPTRPITMIVPFAAGGLNDSLARIIAEPMRRSLGQTIIIENVTGADGSIGVGRLARARPDGYTIDLGPVDSHVFTGGFYSLRYDLLTDFAPISPVARTADVLFARKTIPANDLKGLIVWLKANPNKASAGIGSVFFRVLTVFFQRKPGHNLHSYPIVVLLLQSKSWSPSKLTWYLVLRINCLFSGLET
jgi:tripartite-type tricarboxylate transporter receptor subunit TctC